MSMGKYNNGKNPKNKKSYKHYNNRNVINNYNTPDFMLSTVAPKIIKKWIWVLLILIAVVAMIATYFL